MVCANDTVNSSGVDWGVDTTFRHRANSIHSGTPYKFWGEAVGKYSSRGFTKASDKLVAISGMAKDIANALKDT